MGNTSAGPSGQKRFFFIVCEHDGFTAAYA
jgi:hypothetical protein